LRYSYYPGCTAHGSSVEYDMSTRAVARLLGIELVEVPNWVCCGATSGHMTNEMLSLALPAVSLINARSEGAPVVTACAECFNRLKTTNHEVRTRPSVEQELARIVGKKYEGDVEVKHILEVIVNDVGLDEVKGKVSKNLDGLKVCSYYGCLLVRPPEVMTFDDPEDPTMMDALVEAIGGEPVDWPHKVDCCGASLTISRTDIVYRMCSRILYGAKERGAEVVIAACPVCQPNLDLRQQAIAKIFGEELSIPILYFTQLLGLALGASEKELGLSKLRVDPRPLLKRKGLL
jgi:heterodisulfide reductase subunit B